ncbi:DMT family transporter [Stenotrophomonas bentonitica]
MKGAPIDRRSLGAALIVIVIWSTSFSFAKEAIHHLGPWLFRCYSMAIAVLPLLPFVRRSLVDLWILPPRERRYLLWAVTLTGSVVASLNMLALAYFPASSVLAMMYTMPAFASLIQAGTRRSWSWLTLAAPAAALAGVGVYSGDASLGAGAVLVLCNAVLWAVGTTLSGRVGTALQPFTAVTVQMLIAFMTSLPMVLVAVVAFDQPLRMPSQFDVVGILYAGLLNGALVFWLWYYAIRGLGALRASWFTLFVPVLGAAFAAAFLSERLGGRELLGIGLISLSMLIQRGVSRRQAATTP